jgi:hypothetical protein
MDDRPSFRRQRDVIRLVAAVLAPWVLLAISFVPGLAFGGLYRAGWRVEWAGGPVTSWFYLVSVAAMLVGVGLFIIGVWRLVWYRAYRRSVYGWAWPPLMWASTGGVPLALGH